METGELMYNGSGNMSRDVVKNMFSDTRPNPCPLTLLWILSLYPSCGVMFLLVVYKSFNSDDTRYQTEKCKKQMKVRME